MRVVILGGTFDPIHNGHVSILKNALNRLKADEGWFNLAYQAPLKDSDQLSFETRAKFIELITENEAQLKGCYIEQELPIPNYTYNTMIELKKRYPDTEFIYLIGSDQGAQFNRWHRYEDLMKEVEIVVYPREGYDFDNVNHFRILDLPEYDVSSTEIRNHTSFETHPQILKEIAMKGYYAKERLATHQKESLQAHSIRVATLARELAHHHHLDGDIAYGLGIAHDLYKQMESKAMKKVLNKSEQSYPKEVWHGFVSAKCHQKLMHVDEHYFFEAIYHHTLGLSEEAYSQILYIADKCEPGRKNPDAPRILKLSKEDLNQGFRLCRKLSIEYFERKKNESNSKNN